MPVSTATENLDSLRAAVAGDVVTPQDPGWDVARQAWNLVADQRPELVVVADEIDDVAATVRFATANGLRVAPQSTGHGATSMGDLAGAILLRTSRLTKVDVQADARTAEIQAGACARDVVDAAAEHGLTHLHGSSGGVGVAGYTLGGGLGWFARQEGFASSHVRSFEVVTAAGEHRHVDAEHEPDLFWALRGGGGAPVIVTSFETALIGLRHAFAGSLMWPIEQAAEIVHGYRSWTATVPDALTSSVKLVRFPPLPQVPEPVRGRALVAVTLAFTGSAQDGQELVQPLRQVAAPYLDTLAIVPAPALVDIAGDPPGPLPGIGNGVLIGEFTERVVDDYVALAGPEAQCPLIHLELRHLGGALRATDRDTGAAGTVDADALVFGVGAPVTPEVGTVIHSTLDAVRERFIRPEGQRRTLLGFGEQEPNARHSLEAPAADRLARVAAAYDPDRVLIANHAIDCARD